MAPDHSVNTGCFLLETNRHSPRIFNKNATKLDISTVNNKVDFMRSLDLFCIKNTKESYSKENWEVFLPKNSLPLKKCSVVISCVKCDVCGESLKNQADMEHHKSLHQRLGEKDYENDNDIIKGPNFINNSEDRIMQEIYNIECNNNDILKCEDKIKSYKKNAHRRRNRDGVTKLTLKIGGEVISKVYCKKKYLHKIRSKEQKIFRQHNHENCENCNEIKDILHSTKSNEPALSHAKQSDIEQPDRNLARLRKMAAVLVEHELQRKALRNLERLDFFSEAAEESSQLRNDDDDAVVPVLGNEILSENGSFEDDIQEVLRITRNVRSIGETNINHQSSTQFRGETFAKMKDYEIITIDDEISDNFEDDCVIIDERLSHQSGLESEESSYIFHVSSKDDLKSNALDMESTQLFAEKRKLFCSQLVDSDCVLKKQKTDNALHSSVNCSEILSAQKIQKENKNCEGPTIKLSEFALPLRMINF